MQEEEKNKIVYLHIPKTGGAAMEYYFYNQTKNLRRNYFLSFFGVDDSRFIKDDLSTQRKNGNHCLIESLFSNKKLQLEFEASIHFKQSKLLFGHTVYGWDRIFPNYNFNYVTVIREPIERTISNILQYTTVFPNGFTKFGAFKLPPKNSSEYWEEIYLILTNNRRIQGLLPHENMNFKNCQVRVFEGQDLAIYREDVNLDLAIENATKIQYSLYDSFNEGIQKSFNKLDTPIDMSRNHVPNKKNRSVPQKIVDLLLDWNAKDIQFYNILKSKYE